MSVCFVLFLKQATKIREKYNNVGLGYGETSQQIVKIEQTYNITYHGIGEGK